MSLRARASLALCAAILACACAGGQPSAPSRPPAQDTPDEVDPTEPTETSCGAKTCTAPEQCIRYYGVAGPSIALYTCGLPCGEQGECPDGKRCEAIADGPRMCR
jgi:hypothetical protein